MKKTKFLALLLAVIMILSVIPLGTFTVGAAGNNPYPTSQDVDGDGYAEVPCTRYAWQQAYDNLGVALPEWGNAINWYNGAQSSGYSVGTTAQANSIAVWSIDTHSYGHVAFVTSVSGSNMIINEGGRTDKDNVNGGIVNGQQVPATVGSYWYGRTLIGFIYLSHTHSYTEYVYYWSSHPHYKCYKCSCGEVKENRNQTAFEWSAWAQTKAPTCTEKGVETRTCSLCSETETRDIAALGHSNVTDSAIAATCTETGLTEGSHCAACNAIITAQQVIPALGHNNQIESVERGCDHVSVDYICDRCGQTSSETREDYILSEWSEDYPVNVNESMIESKTQCSYHDKSTTYQDGNSSKEGWTYTGNSEPIYGSWTNVGWTKTKPTESDTVKIADTKTVTDQVAYTVYNYYHYYGWDGDGNLYNSYGNGVWKNYEETSSTTPFPSGQVYDGYQSYSKSVSGKHGTFWWLGSTSNVPAVTHTEWYYQTRAKTTRYYFEKWSDWSDWSDTEYESTETREIQTRTVYRYKITPTGHNYTAVVTNPTCTEQGYTTYTCPDCGDCYVDNYTNATGHFWKADPQTLNIVYDHNNKEHWRTCVFCHKIESALHVFDNDQDTTCNVCGYIREVRPIDENSPQIVVESKKARAGKTVDVNISLNNNPGITSAKIKVYFPAGLTLEDVNFGDIGGMTMMSELDESPITLNWFIGNKDLKASDVIFATLTFKVAEDTPIGTKDITVEFDPDDIFDITNKLIDFVAVDGGIEVIKYEPGDITDDGKVNNQDLVLLFQYLSGWNVEVNEAALDINGDGKENNQDLVLLFQYLSGWDVEIF